MRSTVSLIRGPLKRASAVPAVLPSVGDFAALERRFCDTDVRDFAALSGDNNPVHVDDKFANDSRFGGRVVHGILVSSLFSSILGSLYPGAVYVSQQLRFAAPVPVGATVQATVEVLRVRPRVRALTCATRCIVVSAGAAENGYDKQTIAIDGEAVVLLPPA